MLNSNIPGRKRCRPSALLQSEHFLLTDFKILAEKDIFRKQNLLNSVLEYYHFAESQVQLKLLLPLLLSAEGLNVYISVKSHILLVDEEA